ncbi:ABC transporter permease [Streptococcus devriesei]|uniref:ABC transporter permease n=1 Tax=Streptococcus devriesei TaxID=231233 RepID=UPI00041BFEDF|nr:ABC transporter permease [Streptococcus devriesei]
MKTFKAMLRQEYLVNKRSLSNLIMAVGMPIGFFLLFTTIWANDESMPKEMAKVWIRQYMLQMTAFSSLSFAFYSLPFAFHEDKTGNRLKAVQHSPVPLWQYYVSKIITILVHFVLAIIAVFLVGHFLKGVSMPWKDWLTAGGLLFAGAFCFLPFGTLFAHIKSAQTLSLAANIFYMGLSVLGGLWMPVSTFPKVMQKLAKWTPTYHFNNMVISYFDKDFSIQSLSILFGYAIIVLAIALAVGKKLEVK